MQQSSQIMTATPGSLASATSSPFATLKYSPQRFSPENSYVEDITDGTLQREQEIESDADMELRSMNHSLSSGDKNEAEDERSVAEDVISEKSDRKKRDKSDFREELLNMKQTLKEMNSSREELTQYLKQISDFSSQMSQLKELLSMESARHAKRNSPDRQPSSANRSPMSSRKFRRKPFMSIDIGDSPTKLEEETNSSHLEENSHVEQDMLNHVTLDSIHAGDANNYKDNMKKEEDSFISHHVEGGDFDVSIDMHIPNQDHFEQRDYRDSGSMSQNKEISIENDTSNNFAMSLRADASISTWFLDKNEVVENIPEDSNLHSDLKKSLISANSVDSKEEYDDANAHVLNPNNDEPKTYEIKTLENVFHSLEVINFFTHTIDIVECVERKYSTAGSWPASIRNLLDDRQLKIIWSIFQCYGKSENECVVKFIT